MIKLKVYKDRKLKEVEHIYKRNERPRTGEPLPVFYAENGEKQC